MAGIVLPNRELAQMNDANYSAMKKNAGQLKEALALNADLRAAVSALTKENGDLKRQRDTSMVDALLSKDDELAVMAARCTALADQLGQAQAQLAATSRALNEMMAERDALKHKAAEWFGKTAPEAEAKP